MSDRFFAAMAGGLAMVTVASVAALTGFPVGAPAAQASPTDPDSGRDYPSKGQVDAARKRVADTARTVGRIQAALATENDRLRTIDIRLQQAIEAYDTAADRLERARTSASRATERSTLAAVDVERQRAEIGRWAAASYRQQGDLAVAGAYLAADGPRTLADAAAAAATADHTLDGRVQSLASARVVASVLARQARNAVVARRTAASEAASSKAAVERAESTQQARIDAVTAKRNALTVELAGLRKTSVRLEEARQAGLAAEARRRAEAARRAAEARERARERARARHTGNGGGGNGGNTGGRSTGGPIGGSSAQGAAAVRFALAQLGEPYVFAAAGPSTWDCSGLTMRAWERAGVDMPHFARGQYWQSRKISVGELRPGDLIFWATNPSDSNTIFHVAMYIGGGRMVQAPRPGRDVEIRSMWYMGTPTQYARPG